MRENRSLTQLDSNGEQTWATRFSNQNIFTLQNGVWVHIVGGLTHVTVGKSGVWGVNENDEIFYRQGVTLGTPYGTGWKKLPGALKQIDAGSSGVVYGVNKFVFTILFQIIFILVSSLSVVILCVMFRLCNINCNSFYRNRLSLVTGSTIYSVFLAKRRNFLLFHRTGSIYQESLNMSHVGITAVGQ